MATIKTCVDCGAEFAAYRPNLQMRCHDCQHKRNLAKQSAHAREWHRLHPERTYRPDRPNQGVPPGLQRSRNKGYAHTLEETAKKFGVSRQRVAQIERSALRKLRAGFARMGLHSVAEVLG